MRRPFFVIALIALVAVVGVEVGSTWLLQPANDVNQIAQLLVEQGTPFPQALAQAQQIAETDDPPGLAIPMLAMIDGLLLLSMIGLGLALAVPHRVLARVIAPLNLIVSLILIIVGIILVIVVFVLLFLMIGLFLAVPFGTIVYLARWGLFPRGEAQAILALLLFLKLVFCGFAVAASPRLLTQKGLVALVLTSIVLQLVVGFLHGVVPLPLVSILDALAAIIVAIVAIVWAIVILVGSLIGTIRIIKVRT